MKRYREEEYDFTYMKFLFVCLCILLLGMYFLINQDDDVKPKPDDSLEVLIEDYELGENEPFTCTPDVKPTNANRTSSSIRWVVNMRIPKCASTTMTNAIKVFGQWHHDYWHRIIPDEKSAPGPYISDTSNYAMKKLIRDIQEDMGTSDKRFVYDRNIHFVDFQSYGLDDVAYVSMVRDPVERVASEYYYKPNYKQNDFGKRAPAHHRDRDLEFCVHEGRCKFITGTKRPEFPVAYFCGHADFCNLFNNPRALQQAKCNAEKYFSVVGVAELFRETFIAMDRFIPGYFSKMADGAMRDNPVHLHHNKYRPPVSSKLRRELKANLTSEYEFYEFARMRLLRQIDRISRQRLYPLYKERKLMPWEIKPVITDYDDVEGGGDGEGVKDEI